MISGILLICLMGSGDCAINVSQTFYESTLECEANLKELQEQVNSDNKRRFTINSFKCINWAEEPV